MPPSSRPYLLTTILVTVALYTNWNGVVNDDLYEYGTVSIFAVLGKVGKTLVVNDAGQPEVRDTVRLRFAYDERINDEVGSQPRLLGRGRVIVNQGAGPEADADHVVCAERKMGPKIVVRQVVDRRGRPQCQLSSHRLPTDRRARPARLDVEHPGPRQPARVAVGAVGPGRAQMAAEVETAPVEGGSHRGLGLGRGQCRSQVFLS